MESDHYLAVRNRFFRTYGRDVLHDVLERDCDVIYSGNTSAHGGEIIGGQVVPELTSGIHWSRTGCYSKALI